MATPNQPRFARSAFQGNAKDAVAAIDAYGESSGEVVNAYRSLTQSYFDKMMKGLGTNNKSLLKAVKVLTSSKFDSLSSLDKLDSLLKTQGLSVGTITDDMKGVLSNALGEDKEFVDHLQARVGDTYKQIQNGKYKTASGFMSMAQGLLGDKVIGSVIDQEAELAYFTGMLTEADRWGMPESIDLITKKIKDGDTRKNVFARYGQRYSTSTTSVTGLESLIRNYPDDVGSLTAKRPDLALSILQSYSLETGTTPNQYPAKLTQLVYVLDHLMPNWLYVYRGNEAIYNLTVFARASKDAVKLFQSDTRFYIPASIGPTYPTKTATSIIKSFYPHALV